MPPSRACHLATAEDHVHTDLDSVVGHPRAWSVLLYATFAALTALVLLAMRG